MPSSPAASEPILALLERWRRAELTGATAELAALLAEDFVGVGPMGWLRTRDQWLDRHRSGAVRTDVFELDDLRIVELDAAAALIVARQRQRGVNGAADTSGEFRFSLTVSHGRIRSIHVTRLIEPG